MSGSPIPSMSPDELSASMKQLGLETQLQMAAAIGVSRSSISLWLDGKVGVPRPVAMLIRMLVAAQRRQF
ncbi:MAG TPA: transcriptional regulator [Allosphingosinicella sp.]|jgi:transcriptional regulator with XRE-family HTH domain